MNGPLTAKQLVIILIVAAILVGTFFSIRSNWHHSDQVRQQTDCLLADPSCH